MSARNFAFSGMTFKKMWKQHFAVSEGMLTLLMWPWPVKMAIKSKSVYSRRAARKELGARRASFLADRPTKSTHKEQKILSIWLDFSPFCLQWKSRHSVLSSLTGFEWEAVFRRVDPELVLFVFPALHTLVLTTMGSRTTPRLGGDECQPTRKYIICRSSYACVCDFGRESFGGSDCWEGICTMRESTARVAP